MPRQAAPDRMAERTRRRFVRRQWRRRWLAWKYVAVLAALVVVAGVAVWAFWFSSWLSVKGIDVQGGSVEVPPAAVRAAAHVPLGQALLTTDLAAIERRVETVMPAVESVDVSREWPDKILIKVTGRTPVAVIDEADGLHALDAEGQVFWNYKSPPPGLPVVESTSSDTDALAQGAQVAAALPSGLARKVDHVQVYTADHIALALGDGRTIMWGSAADSVLKEQVLAALMTAQPGAHHYDVSVPGSPVAS